MLHNLAYRERVNMANIEVLEHLLRRGLIVRDPDLHITNESFARFIMSAEDSDRLNAWQVEASRSAWAVMKTPILVTLVIAFVPFFRTAGEEFSAVLTALASSFATLPLLLKSISAIRGAPAGGRGNLNTPAFFQLKLGPSAHWISRLALATRAFGLTGTCSFCASSQTRLRAHSGYDWPYPPDAA